MADSPTFTPTSQPAALKQTTQPAPSSHTAAENREQFLRALGGLSDLRSTQMDQLAAGRADGNPLTSLVIRSKDGPVLTREQMRQELGREYKQFKERQESEEHEFKAQFKIDERALSNSKRSLPKDEYKRQKQALEQRDDEFKKGQEKQKEAFKLLMTQLERGMTERREALFGPDPKEEKRSWQDYVQFGLEAAQQATILASQCAAAHAYFGRETAIYALQIDVDDGAAWQRFGGDVSKQARELNIGPETRFEEWRARQDPALLPSNAPHLQRFTFDTCQAAVRCQTGQVDNEAWKAFGKQTSARARELSASMKQER